ncbi:MAG TPA: hypothetical protein QF520_14875 [SAR202 cluster bacterium]|nr:hypothetical protein [SAR202 cluster bacterium]
MFSTPPRRRESNGGMGVAACVGTASGVASAGAVGTIDGWTIVVGVAGGITVAVGGGSGVLVRAGAGASAVAVATAVAVGTGVGFGAGSEHDATATNIDAKIASRARRMTAPARSAGTDAACGRVEHR